MELAERRFVSTHGDQIVEVGRYTYVWPGDREPLKVGDTVRLPRNPYFAARDAEVTALGSTYAVEMTPDGRPKYDDELVRIRRKMTIDRTR